VRLVKSIVGRPIIVGSGINMAQSIMRFAEPGQILVSRSFYAVMVRLSDDYAKEFQEITKHPFGGDTDLRYQLASVNPT
jgi:class 3 adenylate cyclase